MSPKNNKDKGKLKKKEGRKEIKVGHGHFHILSTYSVSYRHAALIV